VPGANAPGEIFMPDNADARVSRIYSVHWTFGLGVDVSFWCVAEEEDEAEVWAGLITREDTESGRDIDG
jgi:hypothetical protein